MKPLSFLIITYNRPDDMLELAKNISQLDQASELLEEVLIINNASTSDYGAVEAFVGDCPGIPFRYLVAPENLGVARGRNYGLLKGTAPIIIMLDDDAVLQNKDCLLRLLEAFETPVTTRTKGIISFKVLYYSNLEMQKNALPHKNFAAYKDKNFFETYYYAGGAHAIRRDVIEAVGNYPDDFFYGMEEYDLSYRVLDHGFAITYTSSVVMLHKESPLGRKPKAEKTRMMWVNKTKVAWRYLPRWYFYTTSIMWSLQYLRSTVFDISGFLKGWKQVLAIPRKEKRKTISASTLGYLRAVKARLWY